MERFDRLKYLQGEGGEVDYGRGALTRDQRERYKCPDLFVMTLKCLGKRKTVWKTDHQA